ncbi:prepilin-type N-terminal cleavage/methylation domain-containing protein [Tunturiibacter empetritectus]|uniref:prepilin-type N-terminal cleavage/methylation domain-containing protein n=1 Tax=Tunturiibacter empetritectus TaxID=3069691 RepID=UPI003D9ADCA6
MSSKSGCRVQGSGRRVRYTLNPKPYTLHPQSGLTLVELIICVAIVALFRLRGHPYRPLPGQAH